MLCSHSAIKVKKGETTPTSVHSTESLEALYSVVQKKPKADRDKEEKVPPPPPYSVEELYTAMEEEEGAPQIPPHIIEDLYTAVMKKPKGDSADSGTDGAPPIPPHTVDDCMLMNYIIVCDNLFTTVKINYCSLHTQTDTLVF